MKLLVDIPAKLIQDMKDNRFGMYGRKIDKIVLSGTEVSEDERLININDVSNKLSHLGLSQEQISEVLDNSPLEKEPDDLEL